MEDRKNELEIKENPIKEIDIYLNKVLKSVCKIISENKVGTGFLIKLYKDEKELKCLMTNQHIITKEMIELNKIIDIKYKCEEKWIRIKLDKNERYIIYDKNLDVTIIEMIIQDKIKDKYFLLPNINNNIEYINKDIYIVQYPQGKKLSYSEGKIKNIINYELTHDASTKSGSSGSPILIKNTTEVIGIHKQSNMRKPENYGTLISSIIQLLKSENKIYENGEYYIGKILNEAPHGTGKLYYKNGNIKYEGEFVDGKKEGNGKYIYENGKYYSGQWLNDYRHGKGILFYKNDNIKYDGEFANDKFEGKGKLYYKNGKIRYEGEFVNNKFEGKGKYIYESGNYYDGQWLNGKKWKRDRI